MLGLQVSSIASGHVRVRCSEVLCKRVFGYGQSLDFTCAPCGDAGVTTFKLSVGSCGRTLQGAVQARVRVCLAVSPADACSRVLLKMMASVSLEQKNC